jgi:hypothetical protein
MVSALRFPSVCWHFSLLAGPHPRSLSLGGSAPRSGRRRFAFFYVPINIASRFPGAVLRAESVMS